LFTQALIEVFCSSIDHRSVKKRGKKKKYQNGNASFHVSHLLLYKEILTTKWPKLFVMKVLSKSYTDFIGSLVIAVVISTI
jgi:hypothetical protein